MHARDDRIRDYVYAENRLIAGVRQVRSTDPAPCTPLPPRPPRLDPPHHPADGVSVSEIDYLPFGSELTSATTEATRPNGYTPIDPAKFTGHERDGLGLVNDPDGDVLDYMHARYYDGRVGRFLSVDPTWESADLKAPQSWNRYGYVQNNPIKNTDPDGKICIPCAAVGALVAVGHESYQQVKSGEPVNNARLLAAVGLGGAAGATIGALAKVAPVLYNSALANLTVLTSGTTAVASALTPGTETITGVAPSAIRFKQDSSEKTFKAGGAVAEMIDGLKVVQ